MSLKFNHNITRTDVLSVVISQIYKYGVAYHQLIPMNHFYDYTFPKILENYEINKTIKNERDKTQEDRDIESINYKVEFRNVIVGKPVYISQHNGEPHPLTPLDALLQRIPYVAPVTFNVNFKLTATYHNGTEVVRESTIKNIKLGHLPVMTRSNRCNTTVDYRGTPLDAEALRNLGEDETDPGGVFVENGSEWICDSTETVLFNEPRYFRNDGYKDEICRSDMISLLIGGISSRCILRLLRDGRVTIEFNNAKLRDIHIPFYIIYRLLGWTQDREIAQYILVSETTPGFSVRRSMLRQAFITKYPDWDGAKHKYDVNEITEAILQVVERKNPDAFETYDLAREDHRKQARAAIKFIIDKYFIPHITSSKYGESKDIKIAAEEETRDKRLRFFSEQINNLMNVGLQYLPQTDRDSYITKRVQTTNISLEKSTRTFLNASLVDNLKATFEQDLKKNSFSEFDPENAFKKALNRNTFEPMTFITSGNKSEISITKTRSIPNRLMSEALHRRNALNTISAIRSVNSPSSEVSKGSSRANEMRSVHPTYLYSICPTESPEGKRVGIRKQLPISTIVSMPASSEPIKHMLLTNNDVIVDGGINIRETAGEYTDKGFKGGYGHVYVNGDPVGWTPNIHKLYIKYRNKRRSGEIDYHTTIHPDIKTNSLKFWTDGGRPLCPMMIVYNTHRDQDALGIKDKHVGKFEQGVTLTSEIVNKIRDGTLSIDNAIGMRMMEWLAAPELEYLFVAPDLEHLNKNKYNPCYTYTHCAISEQMFSFASLCMAFGHCNTTPRIPLSTNQSRQACSRPSHNWANRVEKDVTVQFIIQRPYIQTFANFITPPNGMNAIVAVNAMGYNEDDAIIASQFAIDAGFMQCQNMTYVTVELEPHERLGAQNPAVTSGIKTYCNYNKLDANGIIKKNSEVEKNDIIVSKYLELPAGEAATSEYYYNDQSVAYKSSQVAYVHDIIRGVNRDGKEFVTVALLIPASLQVGDKVSSRHGQKSIVDKIYSKEKMPRTANGITPHLIISPHAFPSRMTEGHRKEKLIGTYCAAKGTYMDGTIYQSPDIHSIEKELEHMGLEPLGEYEMYNGITGRKINTKLYTGIIYYYRLQKFVAKSIYGVTHANIDIMTRQPLNGKASQGGLKIGEMEITALVAHGVGKFLLEKLFDHSDKFNVYVCRTCGKYMAVNEKRRLYRCNRCGNKSNVSVVKTSWSSKTFFMELASGMNVGTKFILDPYVV